jgi:pyruvate kinase/thymidylate kinase
VTKAPEIMATIGPTLETPEDIRRAVEVGARWFRLPCGYRQRPHLDNALSIRAVERQCGIALHLLLDLPSSRPRTGRMDELRLETGAGVRFVDPQQGPPPDDSAITCVPLPGLTDLLDKISRGQRIWFCDGRLEFLVDGTGEGWVLAHLERGEIPLKSSNSICLPDSPSPFAMVTAEDRALLASLAAAGVSPDWVALSMASSADDVRAGREEVARHCAADTRVMAKIETAIAVDRADSILAVSDGIMVARGDLGPAVDFVRLPEVQEELVRAARAAGKAVVVATQILECFAEVGIPQRCELSDLAQLAAQGPDAVMLGKETVFSRRPIESIRLARCVLDYESRRLSDRRVAVPRSLAASLGRPYVVAVEGPNGAGKTHVCTLLSQRLGLPRLRGVPAAWEEPSLKLHMIRDADWLASAMYFLAGVIEASREAAHSTATIQVMDRSLWSTLAVHYAHDPGRLERLLALLELAAGHVKVPDLTIVLEASPATCASRNSRKAATEQHWDAAAPATDEFHGREREFYHRLAAQWPKVAFIPTDGCDPESVFRLATDLIRESFPCCTF